MNNGIKIIITGARYLNKQKLAETIITIDDELEIANHFTSDIKFKHKETKDCIEYIKSEDIYLSYKNNSLLYVKTEGNISKGITVDEFYNKDIFVMNIDEFNMIPDSILSENDTIVIWLDSKFKNDNDIKQDVFETKFLIEKLQYTRYMYFLDEANEDIAKTIIEYINGDDKIKEKLLEENL